MGLAKRLLRRARLFEAGAERLVRQKARTCMVEVVLGTPVDTGRAKANWRMSSGTPPDDRWYDSPVPGSKGSTAGSNEQVAISQAVTVLQSHMPDDPIYIQNNVPYILQLEHGSSSSQAPAGMARLAVMAAAGIRLTGPLLRGGR